MRIADWIDRRLAGRRRMTLSAVGLVLVLAVIAGAVATTLWLRQGAIADQAGRLNDVAAVIAQHAGRTADSVDLVLGVLAERIGSASPEERNNSEDLRRLLRDHIAGQPHIRSILFIDSAGQGHGDSDASPPRRIDASDRQYFRQHAESAGRGLYIDVPVMSRVSQRWTIVVSRRVQSPTGDFLGVVAAGLDPGIFSDFYLGLSIGGTTTMSLLRTDGRLIARHPPPAGSLGEVVDIDAATDGRKVVSARRAVGRYPLTVLITMPLEAALADWQHQAAIIGAAMVLALLVLVLIGFVLLDQSERLTSIVRALASARDEAIQARLREEDAGRAKTAFLANTSHELRTPLNAILGFSEVLRDGHVGLLEPKQRGYAASIHDAGTHLLGLISDLLDMSRIEARELQLRESVVDVAEVVADGIKLTGRRASERGIIVIPRVPAGAIRIRGDAQRLRQIVLNLLTNAIKFTPAGGRVWIDASVDPGGRPTLMVSDTGIGMTADEVQIALTPFRQVESALARSHEGTGLGLPIVNALVELHGGYLKVESERGVGTRVIVSLPASRLVGESPEIEAAAN